jgi:hypothetical protein
MKGLKSLNNQYAALEQYAIMKLKQNILELTNFEG